MWIRFQYERIPRFCFNCGVVLHGKLGCLKKTTIHIQGEEAEYGPWLRVSPLERCSRTRDGRGWERVVHDQPIPRESRYRGKREGSTSFGAMGATFNGGETPVTSLETAAQSRSLPTVQEGEPILGRNGDQGSINVDRGKKWGVEIFDETVSISKETDLMKETKKGEEVNLEMSQLRENIVRGNDTNGAPVVSNERESGDRKIRAFIPGNFNYGPTIADMERNLANASLSNKAGTKNTSNGNARLTWKRRACGEQPKSSMGVNQEQLGKRKIYVVDGASAKGEKKIQNLRKNADKGTSEMEGNGEVVETNCGSRMAVARKQPRRLK